MHDLEKRKAYRRRKSKEYWAAMTEEQLKAKRERERSHYWRMTEEERKEFNRKACERARVKRREDPEFVWRGWLKRRYGLTIEQWKAMFETQGRRCAICKSESSGWVRNFQIDHCHKTGHIRGILCHHCNRILGIVNDDVVRFRAFIDYLEQPTEGLRRVPQAVLTRPRNKR